VLTFQATKNYLSNWPLKQDKITIVLTFQLTKQTQMFFYFSFNQKFYPSFRLDAFFLDFGGLADGLLTPQFSTDGSLGGRHLRHRQEVGHHHEANVVSEIVEFFSLFFRVKRNGFVMGSCVVLGGFRDLAGMAKFIYTSEICDCY